MKKLLLSFALLAFALVSSGQCLEPTQLTASAITETSAVVGWAGPATNYEVLVVPAGSPAPTPDTSGIVAPTSPYVITGLNCGTVYDFYVRSVCSDSEFSTWSTASTFTTGSCGVNSACYAANSLCTSLDVSFANTTNAPAAQPGVDYDCLFTQPNPTWFYIPISQAGELDFHIHQQNAMGTGLDVDFICWGPFSDPLAPCAGGLNASTEVACSYSAAPDEDLIIPNAQVGQYYMMLVTNFSNQAGDITITQTNLGTPGSGEIGCSGFRLTAFLDNNGNGVKDAGEINFPYGAFHYVKNDDGNIHDIVSSLGTFGVYDVDTSNSYDVTYTVDPAYAANYAVTPASQDNLATIAGAGTQQYYFAVSASQPYNDLIVNIIPSTAPRPGFDYFNIVSYTNAGNQTIASGTVSFTKDPNVAITNISESGAVADANGFTYNFTDLQPFQTRQIYVTMSVPASPAVNINDLLTNSAAIAPTDNDMHPENNTISSTQIVVGSYDPNDKMESHGGQIVFSDFTPADYLYYTIRFENSGTAAAEMVRITDALDSKLDETSVRMVAASHDYTLERTGNQLAWSFDGIQLPAVSSDPEGGKGYVQFMVKPKPGYAIGDIIPNSASIYFDFNPAIVTNTFNTQFVPFLSRPQFDFAGFTMYPNPAGDRVTVSLNQTSGSIASVSIYDMLGKNILVKKTSASANTETIDVSGISSGIYFIEVTASDNLKTVKKLVIE